MVVINHLSSEVKVAMVFDTYKASEYFDHFVINVASTFPYGYIVLAACKDDSQKNLSEVGKEWF